MVPDSPKYENIMTRNLRKALVAGIYMCLIGVSRSQTVATLSDIGANAPTPGPNDIAQFSISGYNANPDSLNYYINNSPGCGQTFTTGSSPTGYQLNSLSIQTAGGGGGGVTNPQTYDLWIYSVSGANATLVASYISQNNATFTETDWLQWSGLSLPLLPNTTYAYAFRDTVTSSWESLYNASGNPYAGGELALIPPNGGTITYGSSHGFDATFDVGLGAGTGVPQITGQPNSKTLYPGETADFRFVTSFVAPTPVAYYWQKTTPSGTVNLVDGGNISGASGSLAASGTIADALEISNISPSDVASYQLIVTNTYGAAKSAVVTLTLGTPTGEAYETAMLTNDPVAYWQLNEVNDGSGTLVAHDYVGGFDGIYEPNAGSVSGPQSGDGFPGFGGANLAASFTQYLNDTAIDVPALYLNTNAVTISAWIDPAANQTGDNGIVFCRGSDTTAGLDYSGSTDTNGNYTLGYTWNNEAGTYNWNSGLVPPVGQWSFVVLVVTPTDATIYLLNTNSLVSATHSYAHVIQPFDSPSQIGNDPESSTGGRVFNGNIDEVGIFNRSLTQAEVVNLYAAAAGEAPRVPATINSEPQSLGSYTGSTVQFTVQASGNPAVSYQWKEGVAGSGVYTSITNGGRIGGAVSPTLTISNIVTADALNYEVVVTNAINSVTSIPVSLVVVSNFVQAGWTLQLPASGTNWSNNGVVVKASNVGPAGSGTTANIVPVTISGISFDTDLSNIPEITNGLSVNSGTNFYSGTDPNVANMLDTWLELDSWATPASSTLTFPGLLIGHTYELQALLGFGWSYSAFNLYGAYGEYAYFADDDTADDGSIGKATYTWTATATNATIQLADNTPNNGTSQVFVFGYALTEVVNLELIPAGKNYILNWTYGTLLQANTVNGVYTAVPGATPPSYTVIPTGAQEYYRVLVHP